MLRLRIMLTGCIGMVGTLIALYFVHRKDRTAEREKRLQYWREQVRHRLSSSPLRAAKPDARVLRRTRSGKTSSRCRRRRGTRSCRSTRPAGARGAAR